VLQPGTPAPNFALDDHAGTLVQLRDLRGSWVVMWWYPKASTSG
jgi:thioredoxin-dependent peroxiredoxin